MLVKEATEGGDRWIRRLSLAKSSANDHFLFFCPLKSLNRILYYSISSLSSIIFIFFLIINNYFNLYFNLNSKFLINSFVLILFIKMRIFPFHDRTIFCYEKSS